MFFRVLLVIVSLVTFLHGVHTSTCDESCTDKPVFSPSRVVVQYGDSLSARCSACQGACRSAQTGLDVLEGQERRDGTLIFWKVDRVTHWHTSAMCYYVDDNDRKCCSELPVTVYQPPQKVHITVEPTNDMYTLLCIVEGVAPIENLIVTFYKGHMKLAEKRSKSKMREPVSEVFTLSMFSTEGVDLSRYWCEAKLDLGPEGPQDLLVVRSQKHEEMYIMPAVMSSGGTMITSFSLCFMLLLFLLV